MSENNAAILNDALASDDEMKNKYLSFWVDGQLFGVSITNVVQIVGMQQITAVPEYPNYAKGIINLRGLVIPLIDVRLRFLKPEIEYNDRTCIIVMNIDDISYGFIVDEVDEVADIMDDQISAPPSMGSETANKYLTGIARVVEDDDSEKIILIIDTALVLGNDKKVLAPQEQE